MEYLTVSTEVIFPLLLFMATGYCIRLSGMAKEQDFDAMNRLVFHIFLPLKLFIDIINSDFRSAFQLKLISFALLGILSSYLISGLIATKFIKGRRTAPVVVQGISRGNYVLFGLSVAANIYPGRNMGVVSAIAAFTVPFYNIITVVLFEFFRGDKPDVKKLLIDLAKNEFVQAALLGGAVIILQLKLPFLLLKPLSDVAALSVTLALICLGASFSFNSMKKHMRLLVICAFFRLAALPGVFIGLGIILGYRDIELSAIMLLFGSPAAAASYTMAKELGGDHELAGMIVALTSVVSIITMFLWIFMLKYFQFI